MNRNPFITFGYEGPEYFCDRQKETSELTSLVRNGNNVVLMSPRRMGKTGLLYHCFGQEEIKNEYSTFIIDILSTSNLSDMVVTMGKAILSQLMPLGQRAISKFTRAVSSLRPTMTMDPMGNANFSIDIAQLSTPEYSLEEIFRYIEESDRHVLIAMDEFQQITSYPEKNVEAVLRTYIQRSKNSTWIFSGSSRHLLSEMFLAPSRPFYASTSFLSLECIPCATYSEFAAGLFEKNGKHLDPAVPEMVYGKFEGVTWFMQRVMNRLYSDTGAGETCTTSMVDYAVREIVDGNATIYTDLLYQLAPRQKELLIAINKEGKAQSISSGKFVKKHSLQSPSTVQTAAKALVDRQLVTFNQGTYEVYDKFFSIWLSSNRI